MHLPRTFAFPIVCCLISAAACAADTKPEALSDPSTAGPDFAVQGEYVGQGCAAQVIALGNDRFHIVGWRAGLPGASEQAEKVVGIDCQRSGDKLSFEGGGWTGEITDGVLSGANTDGNSWKLKKAVRQSPTLGARPPAGAVVLFDGSSVDQWAGGKLDGEGNLVCGTKSKQSFSNFSLHLEFRTPFKPLGRGQDRGNSGVYMQDRYEVQVLDSFGLKGENNECGGIYTIAKPRVNMCFPPLQWQTYDIDFVAAQYDAGGVKTKNALVTVKHNGVLIQDHVEVPKATTAAGRAEGPEPGPIQLQNHGNPVVYRNIWAVEYP